MSILISEAISILTIELVLHQFSARLGLLYMMQLHSLLNATN